MNKEELKDYLESLKSPSAREYKKALDSLTDYGQRNPEILKEIHKIIKKGKDPFQKEAAYEIVGRLQFESSITVLLKQLTDKDSETRAYAIDTLSKYEYIPEPLIPGLKSLITSHKNKEVQLDSVTVIGNLRIEELFDDLITLVRKEGENYPEFYNKVSYALGLINNIRGVPILLEGPPSDEREKALNVISEKYGKDKVIVFQAKSIKELDKVPKALLKDKDLSSALTEGMTSLNDQVRINSIYLFCKIADETHFDFIRSKLKDSNPKVCIIALKWLAGLKKEKVGIDLVNFLDDPEIKPTAVKLLENNFWIPSLVSIGLNSEISERRGSSASILSSLGDKSIDGDIIKALEIEKDDETKVSFIEALGNLTSVDSILPLLDLIFSSNDKVMNAAQASLAKIGPVSKQSEAVIAIESLAKAKKAAEIKKLKENFLKNEELFEDLVCQLIISSKIEHLRAAASEIAGWLKFSEAIGPLCEVIKTDNSSIVRMKASEALIFAGEKAIGSLINSLADQDDIVRKSSSESLIRINKPKKYLDALFNPEPLIKIGISRVFQQLRSSDTLDSLKKAIQIEKEEEQINFEILNEFILALGAPRNSSAIESITPYLESPQATTRGVAVTALGEIADKSTIIPLLSKLDITEIEESVREMASKALDAIGSQSDDLHSVISAIQSLFHPKELENEAIFEIFVSQKLISLPLLHKIIEYPFENITLRKGVVIALGKIKDPKVVPNLIEQLNVRESLKEGGKELWEAIFTSLGSIGDTKHLITVFERKEDISSLVGIINAFKIIKDVNTVPKIISVLNHPNVEVRVSAVEALTSIRHSDTILPLISNLEDKNSEVRASTSKALGFQQDPKSIFPLLEMMDDDDEQIKESAINSLIDIGKANKQPLKQLIEFFIAVRQGKGNENKILTWMGKQKIESIDPWLIEATQSKSFNVRAICARSIGKRKTKKGGKLLVKLLDDNDDYVRGAAAEALGLFGSKEFISSLINTLANRDTRETLGQEIYQFAIESLVKLGFNSLLIDNLNDERTAIRAGLCQTLGKLQATEAIDPVNKLLLNDTVEEVRILSANALGEISHIDCLPGLDYSLANDKSPKVRAACAKSLELINDKSSLFSLLEAEEDKAIDVVVSVAHNALNEISKSTNVESYVKILREIRDETDFEKRIVLAEEVVLSEEEANDFLFNCLNSINSNVREGAARILGLLKLNDAISKLQPLLTDDVDEVRIASVAALGNLGQEVSVDWIVSCLKDKASRKKGEEIWQQCILTLTTVATPQEILKYLDIETEEQRWGVVEALAIIAKEETRDKVEKKLISGTESSINIRGALCRTLEAIGNLESANILINILNDIDPSVRIAAIQSLGSIGNSNSLIELFEKEEDKDSEVRKKATEALDQLAKSCKLEIVLKNFQSLRKKDSQTQAVKKLTKLGDKVSDYLVESLKSQNPLVREGSCLALGSQKHEPARLSIEKLIEDDFDDVRIAVIQALKEISNPESTPLLVHRLVDKETREKGESIWNSAIDSLVSINQVKLILTTTEQLNQISSVRWGLIKVLGNLKVEPKLIVEALNDEVPEIRADACWALGEIGDKKKLPALTEMLNDTFSETREKAALALGKLADDGAIYNLLEMIEDSSTEVINASIKALKSIGTDISKLKIVEGLIEIRKDDTKAIGLNKLSDPKAISYLIQILSSKNPLARKNASIALANLKLEEVIQPLTKLTTDSVEDVKNEAINSLSKIALTHHIPLDTINTLLDRLEDSERIWRSAIEALVVVGQDEPLHDRINHPLPVVRKGIAEIIGRIGNIQSVPQVIKLLKDTDDNVRVQAAIACGQLEDSRSVIPLTHLLDDYSYEVRVSTAKALGKIKDVNAVYSLLEGEEQEEKRVVTASVESLSLLGKNKEEKELVKLLRDLKKGKIDSKFNQDQFMKFKSDRNEIITRILKLDVERKFLRQLLNSVNYLHRASSALALGRANDLNSKPTIRKLLSNKQKLVRASTAEALGLLKDIEAVPLLIEHLKDRDEYMLIREICRDSLALIGQDSVKALVETFIDNDSKDDVKLLSAQALEVIADPESRLPLIDVGLRHKNEKVRQAVIGGLINIGEPVVKDISGVQDDNKRYTRMAAVKILGTIGSVQAMRKLEVAMNDREQIVRESASSELLNIGLSAVKSLCRCLASPRKETARLAAMTLLDLAPSMKKEGITHSDRFLRSVLKKRDKELQATACQALGILGDKESVRDLIELLGNRHEVVRLAAVKALGIMNDGRAIPPLELKLNDKSPTVRIAATEALEVLEKKGIEAKIIEGVTDAIPTSGIRGMLQRAVSDKGAQTLVDSLSSELEEKGLEGVIAKGVEISTEKTSEVKKEKSPLEEIEQPVAKIQQLEKLHSTGILKDEEFELGRKSAIKDIVETVESLPFSKLSTEEIGSILEKITEWNKAEIIPNDDFETLRSLLVSKLIS
ncbi:MAG: HEAT repeat domain-containing protein [Candidatus Hodarchaeales archaeon]|jgi:HEAT repeat protein